MDDALKSLTPELTEEQRVAIDLAHLAAKAADPLQQADADRAMRDELRVPSWLMGALG